MDITLFISRFLYRIRYQIILGSIAVAALVAYFSQFLPKSYTVTTSIYTGIAYNATLEDDRPNTVVLNNTFDNLINITNARGTLENVSMYLFALNMINGSTEEDNRYITSSNYRDLLKIVPEEVHALIDKSSYDKTIEKLKAYKLEEPDNFLYWLFNQPHPHYGYESLEKTEMSRLANSDLVEISYTTNDPGIALNTVNLIREELIATYETIRYRTVNDIVSYYEKELAKTKVILNQLEDDLTQYNIANSVINYTEQTKALAISFTDFSDRYESVLREFESSARVLEQLDSQIETRTLLSESNTEFIKSLNELSTINGKITELETFNSGRANESVSDELTGLKNQMQETEKRIAMLSDQMDKYKYSKEGIAIDDIVARWLDALLTNVKTSAELDVMENRKSDFSEFYEQFSPIGTQINRREREINITEQSYLEILHGLNVAKLKQKNLQLTSSSLNTITPPSFPLSSDGNKRILFTIASFLGSIIFIIGCNLIIELLDRTLRDADRTRRLTNMPVLGAFTGNIQLKYRGYIKACNRISANYICNRLNSYLRPGKTLHINIMSIEDREGKSFVSNYLLEQWEDQGLLAKHYVAGKDFPIDHQYIQATHFEQLHQEDAQDSNIVLYEYPAIYRNSLPVSLLKEADVNILITNAQRVWKKSDDEFIKYLKEMVKDAPLFIYLNNATRETVEDFTGQLPPETSIRTVANRIIYMGFTSRDSSVN
ncbi:hypothetical protein LJC35_01285 [Parabacteroides sp. OttesenSCG-928-N08]|nr:hypothetical protein [Parabacteroides sp. OttesenSCG-928-N08]